MLVAAYSFADYGGCFGEHKNYYPKSYREEIDIQAKKELNQEREERQQTKIRQDKENNEMMRRAQIEARKAELREQ